MQRREHDWFVEAINNPGFTNTDFKTIGITSENTSLADIEVYKNNEYIRSQFETDGEFDELKFTKAYTNALNTYNQLALDTYQDDVNKTYTASRNNIFASPEQRLPEGAELQIGFTKNPMEDVKGIYELGFTEEGPLTIEEIAQTQQVYDPETGKWSDSPNDSFFSNFFNTLVLAQWDYDADINGNPTQDPSQVVYQKGEFKYNNEGKPYYEYLNGRNIAGKTILHKSDILTDDKSSINAIDFFDSDSKEKSTWGVLMKNLVSIAPMLIAPSVVPYVASVYIGTGIALNFAKLATTAGKVLSGSDVGILNNTDGFLDSLNLSQHKSDTKSQWSLANMIDLGGMVFKQLKEQRWLFKYGPALLSGKVWDEAAQEAYKSGKIDEFMKFRDKKMQSMIEDKNSDWFKFFKESQAAAPSYGQTALTQMNEKYQKLGEELSRIYMTGIVVSDSYNEAKMQGLSDMEASAYTLGYALGEYGILKSDIGRWIMPELKLSAHKHRRMLGVMATDMKQAAGDIMERSEKAIANKVKQHGTTFMKAFNKGIDKFKIDSKLGTNLSKFAIANAAAEGVEEVSEEVLADVSKQLFNWASMLRGDESRLNAWDNMFDRYTMSLVGGAIGGGLFSITPDLKKAYKAVDSITTKDQAIAEIAAMHRNGTIDQLYKQIDKETFGSKDLSLVQFTKDENGNSVFAQAKDYKESQDFLIKSALVQQVKAVGDILHKHNLNISDDSILDANILSDVRFSRFLQTSQKTKLLDDFSSKIGDLVRLEGELEGLLNPGNQTLENQLADKKDVNKENDQVEKKKEKELSDKIKDKEKQIKELQEELIQYTNGEKAPDFILDSIFEMEQSLSSPYLVGTLSMFSKIKTGKELKDLNEKEITQLKELFAQYRNGKFAENVQTARQMYDSVLETLAPNINPEYLESLNVQEDEFVLNLESVADSLGTEVTIVDGEQKVQESSNIETLGENLSSSTKGIKAIISFYTPENENEVKEINDELANNQSKLQALQQPLQEAVIDVDTAKLKVSDNPDDITALEEFNEANSKLEKLQNEQAAVEKTIKDLTRKFDLIIAGGFRNNLHSVLDKLQGTVVSSLTKKLIEQAMLEEVIDESDPVWAKLRAIPTNPAEALFKNFSLVLGKDISIPTLIEQLENKLVSSYQKIDDFGMDDIQEQAVQEAVNMLELIKSALNGFRKDAGIDNIFGYSATKNELLNSTLPEINAKQIDPIVRQLNKIQDRLTYLQKIYEINSGQKLKVQERASVNLTTILYKRIQNLSQYIPDEWEGVVEFRQALQKATAIQDIIKQGRTDLSEMELMAIEINKKDVDMAVHTLFNRNKNKLDQLSKIFSLANYPGFVKHNDIIVTDKSNDIDDASFYWYIAALTSVNPSDWYFKYKDLISDSKKAPILVQEAQSFMGYASLVNSDIFSKFAEQLQSALKTEGAKETEDYQPTIPEGSKFYPRFGDVYFIEGVPGGGKSTVIMDNIIKMLGEEHPLLKKVFNVHSSVENAANSAGIWGLKNVTNYDRLKILDIVSHDHLSKFEHKRGKQTPKNIKDVSISDLGLETINSSINKMDNPPTLMIIDEVSLFSTFDIQVIREWCKAHGTKLILMGDMQQTTLGGTIETADYNIKVENSIGYYAHGPKVGISMRGNNTQQSLNEVILRDAIAKGEFPNSPLHWKKQDNSLFGFQVLDNIDAEDMMQEQIDSIRDRIEEMLSFRKPDKDGNLPKIGYIYDSGHDSHILNYCLEKYKNDPRWAKIAENIEKIDGVTFSGIEGQYFIVELPPDPHNIAGDETSYLKQIYTAITRAQFGGLILTNTQLDNTYFTPNISLEDSYTKWEGYSEETIKQYAEKRSRILNQIYKEGKEIPYNQNKDKKDKGENKKEVKEEVQENPEKDEPQNLISLNLKGPSERIRNTIQDKVKNEKTVQENNNNLDEIHKKHQSFTQLLWTFNTNLLTDSNELRNNRVSNDVIKSCEKFRIDGLFGIRRLKGPGIGHEYLVNIYYGLKSAFVHSSTAEELKNKVQSILGQSTEGKEVTFDLAFKSSVVSDEPSKGFERFWMHPSEVTQELSNPKGDKKFPFKRFVGIINIDGKPQIEIPLCTLNNWETVLTSDTFQDIKQELDIWENIPGNKEKSGGDKAFAFGEHLEQKYPQDQRILYFAQLCKMYRFTNNGIFYLKDNIEGKSALEYFLENKEVTGPLIRNTDIDNANKYATYEVQWESMQNYENYKSLKFSRPKVTTNEITTGSGEVIKKGIPFVLVTDKNSIKESDLNDNIDIVNDPSVSVIYLANPTIPAEKYMDYLKTLGDKNNFDKDMGDQLTDFYIAYQLLQDITNDELTTLFSDIKDIEGIKQLFEKTYQEAINKEVNFNTRVQNIKEKTIHVYNKDYKITAFSRHLLIRAYSNEVKGLISKELHKKVINAINTIYPHGIFYNVSIDKDDTRAIKNLNTDKNNPFAINILGELRYFWAVGKIDPSMIITDISPILNSFKTRQIAGVFGMIVSKDNDVYLERVSKKSVQEEVTLDPEVIYTNLGLTESIKNKLRTSQGQLKSEEDVINALINLGHLVLPTTGKSWISQNVLPEGQKMEGDAELYEDENGSVKGVYIVTTNKGKKYKVFESGVKGEYIMEEIIQDQPKTQESLSIEQTQQLVEKLNKVNEIISNLEGETKNIVSEIIKSAGDYNQTINKLNSLATSNNVDMKQVILLIDALTDYVNTLSEIRNSRIQEWEANIKQSGILNLKSDNRLIQNLLNKINEGNIHEYDEKRMNLLKVSLKVIISEDAETNQKFKQYITELYNILGGDTSNENKCDITIS